MTNKEIKIGDKIWLYSACLDENSYYVVSSVKREKTLVTVVVDAKNVLYYKDYQITMYGHASSSLLSGFDGKFQNKDIDYTCDYSLIEEKTKSYNREQKYADAGRALLYLVKYFK